MQCQPMPKRLQIFVLYLKCCIVHERMKRTASRKLSVGSFLIEEEISLEFPMQQKQACKDAHLAE